MKFCFIRMKKIPTDRRIIRGKRKEEKKKRHKTHRARYSRLNLKVMNLGIEGWISGIEVSQGCHGLHCSPLDFGLVDVGPVVGISEPLDAFLKAVILKSPYVPGGIPPFDSKAKVSSHKISWCSSDQARVDDTHSYRFDFAIRLED
jgi:hypothetical protein